MEIHAIPAVATRPVRFEVLWPHRGEVIACSLPEDEASHALHLGAYRPDGRLVGVCTLLQEAPERFPEVLPSGAHPYRLRAMATLPEVRGLGVGRALVDRACAEATARGANFLWFDARRVAYGFYERLGFAYLSDAFQIAPIGEHRVMGQKLA